MISFNFRLIYGLRVLQKSLKIGPSDCIQMSETSELPGALPPGPPRGVGALRRAPGPHADLQSARYALACFSTPTSKNVPRALRTTFDLLFTFFSHQGKVTKIPTAHISLTYMYFAHPIDFFCLTNLKKNKNISGMVSLWYESWC